MNALQRAIETATTLTDFAKAVGVSPQVVSNWRKRGRVPAERVLDVEAATSGKVTRHELRPDLYPAEREAA